MKTKHCNRLCFPRWVTVQQHNDYALISDKLNGNSLRVSGSALKALSLVIAHISRKGFVVLDEVAAEDGAALHFGERLAAKDLLVASPDTEDHLPIFINPRHSMFESETQIGGSKQGSIIFLGAPFNFGNRQTVGTCDAPDAIRLLSKEYSLTTKQLTSRELEPLMDLDIGNSDAGTTPTAYVESGSSVFDAGNVLSDINVSASFALERIEAGVDKILSLGCIPFLLGGDHACTLGALRSCAKVHERFEVVQLDAHTDTYARFFDKCFKSNVDPNHGNFMSYALDELAQISRVHQYGIRGLGNLYQEADRRQIIHPIGASKALALRNSPLRISNNPIYLTIDIDVVDPSVAPGTCSPLPNGFTYQEILMFVANIIGGNNVIGIDLVELDVSRDRDKVTTILGLEVVAFAVSRLLRRRQ